MGHKDIPAVVVEIPREERLLRSLVENIARRYPRPLALMQEIERLKGLGYTNVEVGEKLGICDTVVGGFLALRQAGEERLLDAAMAGRIPLTVAMDIAKAETPELQRGLLKAFETKQLTGVSIRAVKRTGYWYPLVVCTGGETEEVQECNIPLIETAPRNKIGSGRSNPPGSGCPPLLPLGLH